MWFRFNKLYYNINSTTHLNLTNIMFIYLYLINYNYYCLLIIYKHYLVFNNYNIKVYHY